MGIRPAARRIAATGLSVLRRGTRRLLRLAGTYVRAWREALDPTTPDWVSKARTVSSPHTPEQNRSDLQHRIEEAHRR